MEAWLPRCSAGRIRLLLNCCCQMMMCWSQSASMNLMPIGFRWRLLCQPTAPAHTVPWNTTSFCRTFNTRIQDSPPLRRSHRRLESKKTLLILNWTFLPQKGTSFLLCRSSRATFWRIPWRIALNVTIKHGGDCLLEIGVNMTWTTTFAIPAATASLLRNCRIDAPTAEHKYIRRSQRYA